MLHGREIAKICSHGFHWFATCAACRQMTKALLDQRELLKSYRGQKPDISRPGAVPREVKCELAFANRMLPSFLNMPSRNTLQFSSFSIFYFRICLQVVARFFFMRKALYQLWRPLLVIIVICFWMFLETVIERGLVLMCVEDLEEAFGWAVFEEECGHLAKLARHGHKNATSNLCGRIGDPKKSMGRCSTYLWMCLGISCEITLYLFIYLLIDWFIYLYVCMYVCMYVCNYVCMHVCMYVCRSIPLT